MTAVAGVLRAAANLIERGIFDTAHGAFVLAVCSEQGIEPGQPIDTRLYEQASAALAAHLPYPPGQNPARLLRRWSQVTPPADMAREMRAAADNTDRGNH